jgi:uncharacterized protein UPF0164
MFLVTKLKHRSSCLLLSVALSVSIAAGSAQAAPPGFAFLEIPAGARSAALGGALATLSSGAEAMVANAASLDPGHGVQVSAGHNELVQKLRHDYFAIAGHAWGGGLGASVRALYSEPIDERDESGNLIGTFGAHDLELAIGYGTKLTEAVKVGFTAQSIRERIANQSVTTYGIGLGGTWEPPHWQGLRLGFTAQNLGPAGHYEFDGVQGEAVELPAAIQGGASYAIGVGARMNLRGALETRVTRGRSGIGIAGAELSDASGAALRAGFRLNDDASSMSLGAGYVTGGLRLDYAFVPFKLDLGETHRFSFTASF